MPKIVAPNQFECLLNQYMALSSDDQASIPEGARKFSFCSHIQASSGAHLESLADLPRSFCSFPEFLYADASVPQIRPC